MNPYESLKVCIKFQAELGRLRFNIEPSSDPQGIFNIDDQGSITLAKTLDRENISRHLIRVLVRDFGQPARTATASLTVSKHKIQI